MRLLHMLMGLLSLIPCLVEAAEAQQSVAQTVGLDWQPSVGRLVLGLLLVLGLVVLLAWLLRQVQRWQPRSGQIIQVLASQSLGPRERLVLIQVGEQQILLGVAAGQITPVHVLTTPVSVSEEVMNASPDFAQRLVEALAHRGSSKGKGASS